MFARACGFESHLRHHHKNKGLRRIRVGPCFVGPEPEFTSPSPRCHYGRRSRRTSRGPANAFKTIRRGSDFPVPTLRSRLCLQRSVRDVTFVASQPSKRNSHDSDPTAHPHSGSWPLGNVARDVRHRYPCRCLLQPKLDFMSPMISTDHDELRQRLSKVAESSGAELCVLFGSRGRGSAGAGSDVDLALSYRTMPSPQQRLQIIGLFQPAAASCLYYPPTPFGDISH